jgi:hypothetical protein
MCPSSAQNTLQNTLKADDVEEVWQQNVINTPSPPGVGFSNLVNENAISATVAEENCGSGTLTNYSTLKDGESKQFSSLGCPFLYNYEYTKNKISVSTSASFYGEKQLDVLFEELSEKKYELQHFRSLYKSYIHTLSSYILYTKVMILLFYLIIFVILLSYPNYLYSYLYSILYSYYLIVLNFVIK